MLETLVDYFSEKGELSADDYNAYADKPFTISQIKKSFGTYENMQLAVASSKPKKVAAPKDTTSIKSEVKMTKASSEE